MAIGGGSMIKWVIGIAVAVVVVIVATVIYKKNK